MIEKTLVLLKPDAVQRALIGEMLTRFEKPGFKIVGLKLVKADKTIAGEHYADDEEWLKSVGIKSKKAYEKKGKTTDMTEIALGRKIRDQLMDFISMSPCVAVCIEGHGAIEKVRAIVGSTAPIFALPGTIRGDYSFDSYELADTCGRPIQNLIHASDSKDSADREIKIWFKEEELHHFEKIDDSLLYRKVE